MNRNVAAGAVLFLVISGAAVATPRRIKETVPVEMTGLQAKAVAVTLEDAVRVTGSKPEELYVSIQHEGATLRVYWAANNANMRDGGVTYLLDAATLIVRQRCKDPEPGCKEMSPGLLDALRRDASLSSPTPGAMPSKAARDGGHR